MAKTQNLTDEQISVAAIRLGRATKRRKAIAQILPRESREKVGLLIDARATVRAKKLYSPETSAKTKQIAAELRDGIKDVIFGYNNDFVVTDMVTGRPVLDDTLMVAMNWDNADVESRKNFTETIIKRWIKKSPKLSNLKIDFFNGPASRYVIDAETILFSTPGLMKKSFSGWIKSISHEFMHALQFHGITGINPDLLEQSGIWYRTGNPKPKNKFSNPMENEVYTDAVIEQEARAVAKHVSQGIESDILASFRRLYPGMAITM